MAAKGNPLAALNPVTGGLALLGGLLGGGQNRMSAAQRAAINQQRGIADRLYNYGTSNPMTSQEDLNNLAQSLGLLGQQERSNLGALAGFQNPQISTGGMADLLGGIQLQDMGNRESLTSQHMADAIAARRQALLQAAGVNQQTFNMASAQGAQPVSDFGTSLQNLAQALSYKKAARKAGIPPLGTDTSDTSDDTTDTGAGDPPHHEPDPLVVMWCLLQHLIEHHLVHKHAPAAPTVTRQRPKRSRGAGDMPPMGMMGPGMPNSAMGAASPGNEPGGMNSINNQIRQPASALLDRLRFGGSGLQFPF